MGASSVKVVCKSLVLVLGFIWPAYASYKAVEGRGSYDPVVWLTYWIVFSAFIIVDTMLDLMVGYWLPFYYPCQLAVTVWLVFPQGRGASFVYSQLILPLLNKHETRTDSFIELWTQRTTELRSNLLPAAAQGSGNSPADDEQELGEELVFREWDVTQPVPDREAGLRGRIAGSYASLNTTSISAALQGKSPDQQVASRGEHVGDRPGGGAEPARGFPTGHEGDPPQHPKDS
uniref:HVA22-like protein n=1 Tax=Tetraselmis sp. GSL018 TaxID=582737 RepID=A0A061S0D5_9CHLO|mmetsp:Transcript_33331/g.79042  ORF Transcript_33331/g.79042 Transcript_33331/m.79042 type:complete len:232 (-) Transcript_33331:344-1039(-)